MASENPYAICSHTTLLLAACCRLLLVIPSLLLVLACVSLVNFAEPNNHRHHISFASQPTSQCGFGEVFTACCFGESSLMMRSSTSSDFPLTARPPKEDVVAWVTALQSQMDFSVHFAV